MSTTTKEEYVIINKNDMVAIADVVRPLIGTSDTMNIGSLKTNLNSVKENIDKTFAALEEKGVSIPANGNVGDIADLVGGMSAGGGADDLLAFFGGSKYYITSVTPTGGYITSIPITVTDASILSSLKFLLVVSDISASSQSLNGGVAVCAQSTQSLNDEIAVYAPSIDGYIGVRMALSIGKISTSITSAYNAYSYEDYAGETYCDASGGDVWSQYGISISGNKITIGTNSNSYFYKSSQQYKVLLIG